MGRRIVQGVPVRVSVVRGLPPMEVKVQTEITPEVVPDLFVCQDCGREYKTETGLENHIADKH